MSVRPKAQDISQAPHASEGNASQNGGSSQSAHSVYRATVNAQATFAAPEFQAVVIYEAPRDRERAEQFSESFVADVSPARLCNLNLWKCSVLGDREMRNTAAGTAAAADMVIVSLNGRNPLSSDVKKWLEMWLWLIDRVKPAVVALFAIQCAESSRIRTWLQRTAACKGLPFTVRLDGSVIRASAMSSGKHAEGQIESAHPVTLPTLHDRLPLHLK